MTGANVNCPACDRSTLERVEDRQYRCTHCGEDYQERAGGSSEQYRRDYRQHDIGEHYLLRRLRERGWSPVKTGYDPRNPDGTRRTGERPSSASEAPDITVDATRIDVKTTSHPEYHGNVRQFSWNRYPPDVWIAAFVVEEGEVTHTGSYRKGDVDPQGTHDGAHAETWVEVDPGPLADLFAAIRTGHPDDTNAGRFT